MLRSGAPQFSDCPMCLLLPDIDGDPYARHLAAVRRRKPKIQAQRVQMQKGQRLFSSQVRDERLSACCKQTDS
jgi:hypothetical protein